MDNFMARLDVLNLNIRTYCNLKEQYERIGERLDELNKSIKRDIIAEVQSWPESKDYVPDKTTYHGSSGFTAYVQVKRSKRKPDPYLLEELLIEKGLLDQCTSEQIDPDLVEEAFILGKLTDADMRSVIAEPSEPQLALKVERIPNV